MDDDILYFKIDWPFVKLQHVYVHKIKSNIKWLPKLAFHKYLLRIFYLPG